MRPQREKCPSQSSTIPSTQPTHTRSSYFLFLASDRVDTAPLMEYSCTTFWLLIILTCPSSPPESRKSPWWRRAVTCWWWYMSRWRTNQIQGSPSSRTDNPPVWSATMSTRSTWIMTLTFLECRQQLANQKVPLDCSHTLILPSRLPLTTLSSQEQSLVIQSSWAGWIQWLPPFYRSRIEMEAVLATWSQTPMHNAPWWSPAAVTCWFTSYFSSLIFWYWLSINTSLS